MELRHDQAQSVPNDMDVFVAPKDFVATHSGGRVALYDPEGTTRRALESIGLNVHKVTKMQSVKGSRMIIGREALSALSSTFLKELLSFVATGGRVLVCKQKGEQLKVIGRGSCRERGCQS